MTAEESNKIFFEISEKQSALESVNKQIIELKIKLDHLTTIHDVLRNSICQNCVNWKDNKCEYYRSCESLFGGKFKDKRRENNNG